MPPCANVFIAVLCAFVIGIVVGWFALSVEIKREFQRMLSLDSVEAISWFKKKGFRSLDQMVESYRALETKYYESQRKEK